MTAATNRRGDLLTEGRRALQAGDLDTATKRLQALARAEPDNPDALHLLGLVAFRHEQYPLALRLIEEALQRRSPFPAALGNLGSVLMRMEQWEPAQMALEAALRQKPRQAEAMSNLGTVHLECGRLDEAEKWLRWATRLAPRRALAWNNLGNVQRERGEWHGAVRCYRRAQELDPDYYIAVHNLGTALIESGCFGEAESALRRALALEPASVNSLSALARCKRFTPDDPDLALFPAMAANVRRWTRERRVGFFFGWGKAMGDAGRYDDAFVCFEQGNRLRAEERPYDAEAFERFVDEVRDAFPAERIAELQAAGSDDASPIFILGMPRSGTTLTEQILASHSSVHGAGELPALGQAVQACAGDVGEHYGAWLRALDGKQVRAAADAYRAAHPQPTEATPYVTDKMPGNFVHLGLIRLAFPRARIFHCLRDPLDVCLSCYQKDFTEGQEFSFHLESLGRRFRDYARLMAFWRQVFPGQWFDIPYEAVVADPEPWSRAIIQHAGLPWEDACLESHRNERHVLTASVWQVRQPIYRSAVARWRRYESHLGPLREALGDRADWHLRFCDQAARS